MVGFVTNTAAEVPPEAMHTPIADDTLPGGSFGQIAQASFNRGLYPSTLGYMNLTGQRIGAAINPAGNPDLSPEDIKAKYPDVKVDKPMPEFEAKYIQQAQDNERQYQMATRGTSGFKTLSADSAAFFADPVDLGSLFIPVAGEARVASALGVTGETLLGRTAVRAATGAIAGSVSQAPLTALTYGLDKTKQVDYGVADAMRDTLFAGAMGGIALPLFGGIGEAIKGKPEWAQLAGAKYSEQESAAKIGLAQVAKENPVDVAPVLNASQMEQKMADLERQADADPVQAPALRQQMMDLANQRVEQITGVPQKYIDQQHGNGTLGLGARELAETQQAADALSHEEPLDPVAQNEKWAAEADQMEAAFRAKQTDDSALAEHDTWKSQQDTLNKAYEALKNCLMG